jgi:PAS domain S-box-containing protein
MEKQTIMMIGAPPEPPGESASDARVLLANGDADIGDYLRLLLSPRYTVEVVADGTAALTAAQANPPDVVLVDVTLPDMEGFALLRSLRSDARTRTVPVILLSAQSGEEASAAALKAGADDYLVKPFPGPELLARVQAHIALARLRHEAVDEIAAERDRLKAEVSIRQQAEEMLRRQAKLLDLAHDAIIVHDPRGVILFWNDGAAELYGWSVSEAVGQVIHDLLQTRLLPSGAPLAESDVALAAHGTWYGDLEQTRRDGTRVVVESRHSLVEDSNGSPEAVLEVNRDATPRDHLSRLHRITAALSAAVTVEQVANVMVTEGIEALGAKVGVVAVLSEDGTTFKNVRATGHPEEVVTACSGFDADAPVPLADAVRRRALLILESREARHAKNHCLDQKQLETSDGPLVAIPLLVGERAIGGVSLEFAKTHVFTAEERTLMSALGELCAQALDRARLYDAEQQLRTQAEATLGQIADGVIITDSSGYTTYLNRAAKKLFGVDVTGVPAERRSEVYGMVTLEGVPFRTDDLPTMQAIRQQKIVTGVDMCIRRPDGTEIGVQASAAPIVAPNGRISGAVASFRDVSAQRELEHQKDEFLSAVAHDLKTPVAVLQGQAQLLQRWAQRDRLDLERMVEGLNAIETRARMMTGLIDELMDVTRLRMGHHLELNRRSTDLTELVRGIITAQQSVAERHHLVLEAPESEIVAHCDTSRVARLVENVLSNATKFSPGGSEVQVRLHSQQQAGQSWAVLSVRDQGVGIPSRDLPHIFEWFHRADNVVGTTIGTGIGLAVARQIVEQHGGSIDVESEERIGSTFTIRLPLTGPDEQIEPVCE